MMNCDPAWTGYWAYPLPENVMAHMDHWSDVQHAFGIMSLAAFLILMVVERWRKT